MANLYSMSVPYYAQNHLISDAGKAYYTWIIESFNIHNYTKKKDYLLTKTALSFAINNLVIFW